MDKKKTKSFEFSLFYGVSYDFCFWYINHMKKFLIYVIVHSHHCNFTNQIIALTINHDNQIIANHNAAFFRVFNPASYHLLSPHDVSILNQAYRQIHNAMVAKIPKIQFIVFFIVSSNADEGHSSVPITLRIPGTNHKGSSQNQLAKHVHGIMLLANMFSHNATMIQYNVFFILLRIKPLL